MTAFDRFEQDLPELMTELAAARVPDYLDDMLRQSARTRQRPRWSALERWIPMGVIARTAPVRQIPWRPIVVAAVLIVLVAASLALYAGSRPRPLPAPFGPALNGNVLISAKDGDIAAVDLATGVTRPVITGAAYDEAPGFAPDGRSFQFGRTTDDSGIWVAGADGTGAHRIFDWTGFDLVSINWSQAGDRIVATGSDRGAAPVILLIDPVTGAATTLHPNRPFLAAVMAYGRDQLLLTGELDGYNGFWLMDPADPSNPRQLTSASTFAINEPALSPDGTKFVYATWQDGAGSGANLHVVDLASGIDTRVTSTGSRALEWQAPWFMPDGKSILASRFDNANGTFQLTLVPADGVGPDRPIGPIRTQHSGGATGYISPDGGAILAIYHDNGVEDGKIWSIDVASGVGTELPWAAPEYLTWQRVGR
jgi:Tol biopolymer transport system component